MTPKPDPLAGPWFTDHECGHECVIDDSGFLVADCAIFGPSADQQGNIVRANAISAVPEALALAQWVDHHFDDQNMSHVDFRVEVAKLARDYLAKARGV